MNIEEYARKFIYDQIKPEYFKDINSRLNLIEEFQKFVLFIRKYQIGKDVQIVQRFLIDKQMDVNCKPCEMIKEMLRQIKEVTT